MATRDQIRGKKLNILILGSTCLGIFGLRGELIQALVELGHSVTVCFPNGPYGEGEEISRQYGCRFVELSMERRKTNPVTDLKLIVNYVRLIRSVKPDVVLAFTVKCDTYGGVASRLTRTPFIANITGLGKGLAEGGMVEKILVRIYRVALKKAHMVFFQNTSDRQYFIDNRIKFPRCVVLPGSGVNLSKYRPLEYPRSEPVVFTFIGRVMKPKGIEQFLDAARALKGRAEFHICGYCEEDYEDIVRQEEAAGCIVYHGLVDNVIDYEEMSHCIVLPSFHPEGVCNVLLEAAACARPIITTDWVGCRETVDDGRSGFLVKPRDSRDLIEKMERFLSLSFEERREMGLRGRAKVEREFDRNIVVDQYIRAMEDL